MCGRFYLNVQADELRALLSLSGSTELQPRYNIAPSQPVLVVVAEEDARTARWFRWGLIPSWAKDTKFGYHTINARTETEAEKTAFAPPFGVGAA
ncbi:MAG: SOS response-associated peptidase family protein [Candidatus Thiodiazotropha sp.]